MPSLSCERLEPSLQTTACNVFAQLAHSCCCQAARHLSAPSRNPCLLTQGCHMRHHVPHARGAQVFNHSPLVAPGQMCSTSCVYCGPCPRVGMTCRRGPSTGGQHTPCCHPSTCIPRAGEASISFSNTRHSPVVSWRRVACNHQFFCFLLKEALSHEAYMAAVRCGDGKHSWHSGCEHA